MINTKNNQKRCWNDEGRREFGTLQVFYFLSVSYAIKKPTEFEFTTTSFRLVNGQLRLARYI